MSQNQTESKPQDVEEPRNDGLNETPCYPPCWVFDINRRVYRRNENGKPCGGPIWREHWREMKIVGETKVSWITEWGKKIPKKGGQGICFSERELEEASWVQENRHRLSDAVLSLNDFTTLKAVSEILWDNAPGLAQAAQDSIQHDK